MENINNNAEYYKSISLAWAELAIYNYWLVYDHDELQEKFLNILLSHGQVVYHEFKQDFERLWLTFFPDLCNIPSDITDDFICDDCKEHSSQDNNQILEENDDWPF